MPTHTPSERAKNKARAKPKAKNFIAAATKNKGGLRRNIEKKFDVKIPAGKNIPKRLIAKAASLPKTSALNDLMRKQASLAKTLSKLRPKKKK